MGGGGVRCGIRGYLRCPAGAEEGVARDEEDDDDGDEVNGDEVNGDVLQWRASTLNELIAY